MKTFIRSFFVLMLFPLHLFSQWSTDPNNNLIVGYGLNPDLCSDSAGGCYITYEYGTTGYPRKLGLERLDKYGYTPWGTLKQIPGELPEQWYAEIIEDGVGGVIVSYLDDLITGSDFIYRVRVQRVDSAGNLLWGQTGVRVTITEINHGDQAIVSDGNGGCVVVWSDELQNYTYDYRANRINNLGERTWGDTGILLENNDYTQSTSIVRASDGNYYVRIRTSLYRIKENGKIIRQDSVTLTENIIPDPEGGVVLSGRVGNINNRKLVAQRQDSLGNNLWQEPYVEVADSLYINTRNKMMSNSGLYYFSWSGMENGIDVIAKFQALRLDGSKLFSDGGISINDGLPLSIAGIIPSESGKTIFIWNNDPNLPDSTLTQIYDTLGNKLWDKDGIVVADPAISYQGYTIDRNGGFIITGIINEFTVVAQQVSQYGNLGEIITSVHQEYQEIFPSEIILYQNYPNPFNSSTVISYSIPREGKVTLELYNALGELITTIINDFFDAGMHIVSLSSDNLPSGVYLYKLQTDTQVLIKKLLIIK